MVSPSVRDDISMASAPNDGSLVAVAVVNYNTRELLRACLHSIEAEAPCEIVVVDNASDDGSAEMVAHEFPNVILRRNRENVGYGSAANQAIALCQAPYVLLLNSDTAVQPGALGALANYLTAHPRVAIVGPRLQNVDGTLYHSCFPYPSLLDFTLDVSNTYRLIQCVPLLRERVLRTWSHTSCRRVPWVNGAALVLRRIGFEAVGGFDTTFFMYSEEVDLCYRIAQDGWEVHYMPVAQVVHLGGASTAQHRTDMLVALYVSLAHFYRLHYSTKRLVLFAVFLEMAILARLVRDALLVRLTVDAGRRTILIANMRAWQRLLMGEWRRSGISD